ncbi:MAG: hypothetical protein ABF260_06295 [Flavobacteriaceae bacterium]
MSLKQIKQIEFLSPLMQQWVDEYVKNEDKITSVGLFYWEFRENRRNPEKPMRKVVYDFENSYILLDTSFKNSLLFYQKSENIIHVYRSSGFSLGGESSAYEYEFNGNEFSKSKAALLKMIR